MNVSRKLFALAIAGALSAGSAVAADKKPNADRAKATATSDSSAAVSALATALALVRYGDTHKDALALITAARLIKQASPTPTEFQRVAGIADSAKSAQDALTVDAILARAKGFAASDASLLALADDVAKSGSRGAVGGPKYARTVVRAGAYHDFRVAFEGGMPARVLVSGDGDSDLDLYVYDERGNPVCKDDDATDDMICGWTPRWTGNFILRIVNRGVPNEYLLATN